MVFMVIYIYIYQLKSTLVKTIYIFVMIHQNIKIEMEFLETLFPSLKLEG